jgi:hypothetical protein
MCSQTAVVVRTEDSEFVAEGADDVNGPDHMFRTAQRRVHFVQFTLIKSEHISVTGNVNARAMLNRYFFTKEINLHKSYREPLYFLMYK